MTDFIKIGNRRYKHTASGMIAEFVAVKSGWIANGYVWPSLRAAADEIRGVSER